MWVAAASSSSKSVLQDQFLLEPAVLVSSFDVTSQKEVEMELETAKKQLLM